MAKDITRGGEVYFTRERDFISGAVSPYVKIGITKDDRESSARRDEQQTDNPRELVLYETVKVDLVFTVEKALHWHFAEKRVTGEWFLLSDEQLDEAIKKCRALGEEFKEYVSPFKSAVRLSKMESTGGPIPASPEARMWWRRHQVASYLVSMCDEAREGYKEALKDRVAEGGDLGSIADYQKRMAPVFDEGGFKSKYPELWTQYLQPAEPSGKVLIVKGTETELQSDSEVVAIVPAIHEFKESIERFRREGFSLDELGAAYVRFLSLTEYLRVRELHAKYHLMSLCGTSSEITGVCKWKRTAKPPKLNRKSLEAGAPKEYYEFTTFVERAAVVPARKLGAAAADED